MWAHLENGVVTLAHGSACARGRGGGQHERAHDAGAGAGGCAPFRATSFANLSIWDWSTESLKTTMYSARRVSGRAGRARDAAERRARDALPDVMARAGVAERVVLVRAVVLVRCGRGSCGGRGRFAGAG